MTSTRMELAVERLRDALQATDSSARLEAALAAGSSPEPDYIEVLIERCAIPESAAAKLAETLATQFARGGRDVQLSLSRAFVAIGEGASIAVERATTAEDPLVSAHANATERLMRDPEQGFDAALADARRAVALRDAPNREA